MMKSTWILALVWVLVLPASPLYAGHALNSPVAITNPGNFYVPGNADFDGTVVFDGVCTYNANATFTLDLSIGDDLTVTNDIACDSLYASTNVTVGATLATVDATVSGDLTVTDDASCDSLYAGGNVNVAGLIYGRQPTAQYYKATATDTVQDVNVSTAVAIKWGTETLEDTGFTHGTTSLKSRCYLDGAGWYRVTYNITNILGAGERKMIKCYGKANGSTTITPSASYSYSRNTTYGEWGTNTAVFLYESSGADEYIEIMGMGVSSDVDVNAANTVLDECWVLIERLF